MVTRWRLRLPCVWSSMARAACLSGGIMRTCTWPEPSAMPGYASSERPCWWFLRLLREGR
jgi:hypothetical protein